MECKRPWLGVMVNRRVLCEHHTAYELPIQIATTVADLRRSIGSLHRIGIKPGTRKMKSPQWIGRHRRSLLQSGMAVAYLEERTETNPTFHERNRPMSRLPRLPLIATLLLISIMPMAAHAAPLGRVPLANNTASFDGYYGYDGKYHHPYSSSRPASPLDTIWRPSGYSRYGSAYGYWGSRGR
jgi:hypothetical protein